MFCIISVSASMCSYCPCFPSLVHLDFILLFSGSSRLKFSVRTAMQFHSMSVSSVTTHERRLMGHGGSHMAGPRMDTSALSESSAMNNPCI